MKTTRQIQVGLKATHHLYIAPGERMTMERYTILRAAGERTTYPQQQGIEEWRPENYATFTSVGKAIGWIKRYLGKPGWPNATRWLITQDMAGDTWSVYMINTEEAFAALPTL